MTVLVRRTNSFMVSAQHRCHRPAAAEARTQSWARYDGARPCRHLKTIMASLNDIRCRLGSQWRSHCMCIGKLLNSHAHNMHSQWQCVQRGARPWRHLKTIMASLNDIRCRLGSRFGTVYQHEGHTACVLVNCSTLMLITRTASESVCSKCVLTSYGKLKVKRRADTEKQWTVLKLYC